MMMMHRSQGRGFLLHVFRYMYVSHGVMPLTGSKTIDYLDPVQYSSHPEMSFATSSTLTSGQNHTHGMRACLYLFFSESIDAFCKHNYISLLLLYIDVVVVVCWSSSRWIYISTHWQWRKQCNANRLIWVRITTTNIMCLRYSAGQMVFDYSSS